MVRLPTADRLTAHSNGRARMTPTETRGTATDEQMSSHQNRGQLEYAAASLRAVGHPTRMQILEALRHADALSPKELAEGIEPTLTLGTISHHMRALSAAGLV